MELENSTGNNLKEIRLRLGWSTAELARHLALSVDKTLQLEQDTQKLTPKLKASYAELLRYADDYSNRIQQDPFAEKVMNLKKLSQITGTDLFHLKDKDFVD